jgi:diguanylate cyclase (GGDEF)-like protein
MIQQRQLETGVLLHILDISRRMVELRAFEPLLVYVVEEAIKLVRAEQGYLVLFQPDGSLEFRVTRDRQGRPVENADDQISKTILQTVLKTREARIVGDAMADEQFAHSHSVRLLQIRSVMCAPLVSYGQVIGAIYIENRSIRHLFREADLTPLLLFANQATAAIENAAHHDDLEARVAERTSELEQSKLELEQRLQEIERLNARLEELSTRDSLTGAFNRRYLEHAGRRLFFQAEQTIRPLALAMFDIDDFKLINDTFSHHVGDLVLQKLVEMVSTELRERDLVARFGGEEFVLLLPETPHLDAVQICERLRARIAAHDWSQVKPSLRVTISLGVAVSTPFESFERQLHTADHYLYAAKRSGKNIVVAE